MVEAVVVGNGVTETPAVDVASGMGAATDRIFVKEVDSCWVSADKIASTDVMLKWDSKEGLPFDFGAVEEDSSLVISRRLVRLRV